MLNKISTFILFAFATALFTFVALIFLNFSGISGAFPVTVGRFGFYALPLTLGVLAGIVAISVKGKKVSDTTSSETLQ